MASPAANVLHPGLAPAAGAPLVTAAAGLRDRERLAVLLQGIGLLAILTRAGWRLARGWRGAAVAEDLVLTGAEAEPGLARLLPQESLRELVVLLFGGDEVAGRGEARRVARDVVAPWRQALAPIVPELAVASLLNATALLWEDWAGAARRGLVGRLARGRSWQLWVAAPRAMRSHLLATAPTHDELICLLGGSRAREEWLCAAGALGGNGRRAPRRATLATWQDAPPAGLTERRAWAEELFVAGRFQAALAVELPDDLPTRVLHLRCHHDLGDLAAQRQVLRQLPAGPFDLETELQVAEIAVRLASKSGDEAGGRTWVARARKAAGVAPAAALQSPEEAGPLSPSAAIAEILTANAAADQGRPAAMSVHLDAARSALGDPEVTWRWHAARALQALKLGDGATAVSHAEGALRAGRHGLPRSTTGRLWSDLAVARFVAGDLAGAERACAHAAHRLQACDGNLAVTLALPNLAEIRLRRGRLQGVEEILARTERENARLGNVLGAGHDRQLRVRYDLARGEATLALERARALLNDLPASGCRATVLRLFAARALGWLSRPADAAADLAAGGADALEELEPEERPAVWVLAGRPDEAWREAERSRHGGLWRAVLRGERAAPELWDAVEELEPFRAARLVFDVELVSPALVPPRWLRRSIATLRRLGVDRLASRLEATSIDPWTAVAGYLALPAGDRAALRDLFVAAGFGDVRLWWQGAEDAVVIVDGSGGGEELMAPLAGGSLHLRAAVVDPPLRALFQLARRELRPGGAGLLTATSEIGQSPVPRGGSSFVGNSQPVLQALDRLARFARTELPVLVLGETGTGKELAASEVHRLSRRAAAPFLAVNCAAFSETLIQSELFGHVRGAFTGADRDRAGLFETARGGTVFLDEIGDLPLAAQGNLLRLLQEGEVRRLGESVARRVDVRVVAATHRELVDMVAAGTFRGDLLYRLRGGTVRLPPLRERGDDVLLLAGRVLARAAAAGVSRRLSPAARAALLSHSWPGNVRELQNVLEAAVALADLVIEPVHLELPLPTTSARATAVGDYHRQVEQFRKKLIADAIAAADGNMAAAARVLGVSRQTLSYAVRELGIDWPGPTGASRRRP